MSNKKVSRDPDLLSRLLSDISLALRLMVDRRVGGWSKLIPVLMVVYIVSPLDFVPDLLVPFGVVDDLGVFLLGLQWFIHSAPRDVVEEIRGLRPKAAPGTQRTADGALPPVIEGHYEVLDDLDAAWDDYDEYEDDYDEYEDDDDQPGRFTFDQRGRR